MSEVRYARLYSDGGFNVSSEGEDFAKAKSLLSGSSDDDDTQLVQVEIRVVKSFGYPRLKLVPAVVSIRDVLEQALGYIRGETPEGCSVRDAREDIIEKIKAAAAIIETAHD